MMLLRTTNTTTPKLRSVTLDQPLDNKKKILFAVMFRHLLYHVVYI